MVSADLLWLITKKNNTFIVKRNEQVFSKDPLNLTNIHSKSQCGFINEQSIGLVNGPKGVKVIHKTSVKNAEFPSKSHKRHNLRANHFKQGQKKLLNIITKNAHADKHYKKVQQRAIKLFRANKPTPSKA